MPSPEATRDGRALMALCCATLVVDTVFENYLVSYLMFQVGAGVCVFARVCVRMRRSVRVRVGMHRCVGVGIVVWVCVYVSLPVCLSTV